mgnify:FL=1
MKLKMILPLFVLMLWGAYKISLSNEESTKTTLISTESTQIVEQPINNINSDAAFKSIGVSPNNDFDDSTTIESPLFTLGDQWVISKSSLFNTESGSQNRSTLCTRQFF